MPMTSITTANPAPAFRPVMTAAKRPARNHSNRIAAGVFLVVVIAVWQVYSMYVPHYLFPGPWPVLRRAFTMWSTPQTIELALMTVRHVLSAVAIAFTLGTAIAVLASFVPILNLAVYNRLTPFLNSFAAVGWAFLGVVWFGLSSTTVIFSVSAVLLPFAIINVGTGLREMNREVTEMGLSFTRNVGRRIRLVILPLLMPYLFATLRTCISMAWKVTLTAEIFAGRGGLGALINVARQRFDTEIIFAVILLLVAVVYGLDRLVLEPIQNRLRKNAVA